MATKDVLLVLLSGAGIVISFLQLVISIINAINGPKRK